MTGPSSTPRGEHASRPGTTWQTALVTSGEQLVDDDTPTPRPNRATRRAAKHARRPPANKEQHVMTDPTTTADRPRTFGLIRDHDVTGISGTGRVADGTLWPDGSASVRWRGDRPSTVWWVSLADVEHIHGHGGHTRIVWDDEAAAPHTVAYEQACKALETHRQRADTAEAERDGAYRERAQLLAWLAALHPAVLAPAPDVDEAGWQILYLNPAAGGQMSWHIAPRDSNLFGHVEQVPADDERAQWDGHTTETKYQRINDLATVLAATQEWTGRALCTCSTETRCAACRTANVERPQLRGTDAAREAIRQARGHDAAPQTPILFANDTTEES